MSTRIVVTSGCYTQAVKAKTRERRIELIPRISPLFHISDHKLVLKHEVLRPEEREKPLTEYHVQPFQVPTVRTSDHALKAIDGKAGDIVKII